jgi:hypothetical protein
MPLKQIRLELARDAQHPHGNAGHGYEFFAPLDDSGHLQAEEWKKLRERCEVRRFVPGEREEIGRLVHRRGGSWAFDYDPKSQNDDEPGFKFSTHAFVPDEYVSITEHDGVQRTFRVIFVEDAG